MAQLFDSLCLNKSHYTMWEYDSLLISNRLFIPKWSTYFTLHTLCSSLINKCVSIKKIAHYLLTKFLIPAPSHFIKTSLFHTRYLKIWTYVAWCSLHLLFVASIITSTDPFQQIGVSDYHYCLSGCAAMPYGWQVLTVWKNMLFLSSAFLSKLKMEVAGYPANVSNSLPNCMSPQPARCRLTIRCHKNLTFLKKMFPCLLSCHLLWL